MFTVGTFLLAIFLIQLLLKKKNVKQIYMQLFFITAFLELTVQKGYFIQIGSTQITYRTICELLLTIVSIVYIITSLYKIEIKLAKLYFLCALSLIMGWFFLILFPTGARGGNYNVPWDEVISRGAQLELITFNLSMFVEIIQIFMFLLISLCAVRALSREDWLVIYRKMIHASRVYIFFCLLEPFSLYMLKGNFFRDLSDGILGKSISTVSGIAIRENKYALCGMTKEPSHFAYTLVIIVLLNIGYVQYLRQDFEFFQNAYSLNESKKCRSTIFFSMLLSFLAMSFSAYYFIACIMLFLFIIYCNKHDKYGIPSIMYISSITIAVIIVNSIIPFIFNMLTINTFLGRRTISLFQELSASLSGNWSTITSTTLELSNKARIGSTIETLKLLRYRPILGLGLTSVTAHSSFAMLLTGCGFLGTYLYLKVVFYVKHIQIVNYKQSLYLMCIFTYCAMNLFNGWALRPYYECWVLPLGITFQFFTIDNSSFLQNKHINRK